MKTKHMLICAGILACLAGAVRAQPRDPAQTDAPPPRGPRADHQPYSITQAVSDQAQLHTIAFNGLAFLTGDYGACTFLPPGKVCDFFGFQYMRDIDAARKGHNPMFLNRVSGNVLKTLDEAQKKRFLDLAVEQAPQLEALARMRLPLIRAFWQTRNGEIPQGSAGLNRDAVRAYVGDIFEKDAALSLRRAEVMAAVARSLSPEQKAFFAKMKFGDFGTWPEISPEEQAALRLKRDAAPKGGESKLLNVAYMTYASEFFSWTAGSVEADTYFCPERHGTYFGGFYMKDMPAMGKRDYDISTAVTGDSGQQFVDTVLTPEQRAAVVSVIDAQRPSVAEMIKVRREIAQELRKYLAGEPVDKAKVLALGRRYGELDGDVSWLYVTAFAQVNKTLTDAQRAALMKLRNLDGYKSAPYYIYSQAAKDALSPPSTQRFFFPPQK